jgi:hypothetical protein
MSMICRLCALTTGQIAAFCTDPELASDFAEISDGDLTAARLETAFARIPPAVREQYMADRRELMARDSGLADQLARQRAARPLLAKLGPFEPLLDLDKTWNILHYLLTGHANATASPGDALLNGSPLGRDLGYGPSRLHNLREVEAFRDFLAPLNSERVVASALTQT